MDIAKIPWEQGIGFILGVVLLKILIDLVYKKIPRGFRMLATRFIKLEIAMDNMKDDNHELLQSVRKALKKLQKQKRTPPARRKRGGGAHQAGDP